jgi:hypothetical protein
MVQVSNRLSEWINKLRHNLRPKPALTEVLRIPCINAVYCSTVTNAVYWPWCTYVPTWIAVWVWVRVNWCWITVQQMRHLLRKTRPSSRRRGGFFLKHICSLGTNKNMVTDSDGPESQQQITARLCSGPQPSNTEVLGRISTVGGRYQATSTWRFSRMERLEMWWSYL